MGGGRGWEGRAQRPLRGVSFLWGLLGDIGLAKPEKGTGGGQKHKGSNTKQNQTDTQEGSPAWESLSEGTRGTSSPQPLDVPQAKGKETQTSAGLSVGAISFVFSFNVSSLGL